jgi:hypothetical protein
MAHERVLDSPEGWVARHIRRYLDSDGANGHEWRPGTELTAARDGSGWAGSGVWTTGAAPGAVGLPSRLGGPTISGRGSGVAGCAGGPGWATAGRGLCRAGRGVCGAGRRFRRTG